MLIMTALIREVLLMKNEVPDEKAPAIKEFSLESVISSAVKVPGVKVDRRKFLADQFSSCDVSVQDILDLGPVEAGVSQEKLDEIAKKLIWKRTSFTTAMAFAAGLPGGIAMAATIPADVLQFFAVALRLAQELSYLYGAQDLWEDGELDDERVKSQLVLYCGVMFGVSGAVSGVRVLSSQIAKTTLKKLPQQALTKTFWYPIIKQIGAGIGVKVTKTTVAGGIAKAVPVVGGVISGGLNFASMYPMANRLKTALDSASFGYTQADFDSDIMEIENISEDIAEENAAHEHGFNVQLAKEKVIEGGKNAANSVADFFAKKKPETTGANDDDIFNKITKLAELKEQGIITQEEFDEKKTELLSRL